MPAAPAKLKPHRPPCLTSVEFVPLGDGTFKAIPHKPVEVGSLSVAAKLTGISRDVLYRTGFIKGSQPSPGKIMVDLNSLLAHIEASKDEEFWNKARKKQFETLERF